jgi:hemolysin III
MEPKWDRREELLNATCHGLGFLAALVLLPFLLVEAAQRGTALHVTGCAVFGVSMLATLAASTVYHCSVQPRRRRILRVIDHASIFLMIAGCYTPFCLTSLPSFWGWTLFGIVWGIASFGVVFKLFFTGRYELFSMLLYLGLGWAGMIAIGPMVESLQTATLVLVFSAGAAFTIGVGFYLYDHKRWFHFAWHLCVVAGCCCLYGAVFTELPG